MFWRMIISVPFFWCAMAQALPSGSFPPPGMTLPEYWGEEHVWWDGRASFKGQVIAPACTLAMEDAWQEIDMEPRHSGTYRTALPVPRKNSGYGYATVSLQVQESRSIRQPGCV